MRELILLRHAHAELAAPGQDDLDRPLSLQGQAEAEAAGAWLLGQGLLPDRVLCSPARRTRETCEAVLERIGYAEMRQEARIYEASPGRLIQVADEHLELGRVLLIGHNPGLEQLVALLCSGRSEAFRGMPAGAVAVLALPEEGPMEPGIARLAAFWSP
ncbi:MAG TPA: histidine phosphatase family protein [Arenimonas sp.]|jgi:phosphohistidine phosphatase SixA|nr:histidine phosphatase family protein [Arenimonas sp.]